jgi:hypothetical protein
VVASGENQESIKNRLTASRRPLSEPAFGTTSTAMPAYAAMMTGQERLAVVKGMPEEVLKEYAMLGEAFVATPYEVLLRFAPNKALSLGANLMQAGHFAEAEQVYR